jgi:hypothetical protein
MVLNSSKLADPNNSIEPLKRLIHVMQKDPIINAEVIKILNLDSYQRRSVLNNWLEQLRLRKAPENLLSALCCLFDDKIAREVLVLINKRKI